MIATVSNTCVREFCKEVIVRDCKFDAGVTWVMDKAHPMLGVKLNPTTYPLTIAQLSIKWIYVDGNNIT